jgi:AraC family transcriptional regulator
MSSAGAYGQHLADCFRLGAPPTFVAQTLNRSGIAVTQIVCNVENNGLTAPIPRQDAFLVTLQLRECPSHDLWIDGKAMKTGHLAAGTTCIYDLRHSPIVNSISPFRNLHFYFSRTALDNIAAGDGTSGLDTLRHNPGFGIDDPVIRGLGLSLLPAFEQPDEASALFVDHVTNAVAVYFAGRFGSAPAGASRLGLARWQEERAKELLTARLDGRVSIRELARECGLSARSFSRAFTQSTGLPPHRWLLQQRMDKAKDLLINSALQLAEIASVCGFAGAAHFARAFARQAGVPPHIWRGRRRQQEC